MPALVAGIHVFKPRKIKTWMAGTSPAMTTLERRARVRVRYFTSFTPHMASKFW